VRALRRCRRRAPRLRSAPVVWIREIRHTAASWRAGSLGERPCSTVRPIEPFPRRWLEGRLGSDQLPSGLTGLIVGRSLRAAISNGYSKQWLLECACPSPRRAAAALRSRSPLPRGQRGGFWRRPRNVPNRLREQLLGPVARVGRHVPGQRKGERAGLGGVGEHARRVDALEQRSQVSRRRRPPRRRVVRERRRPVGPPLGYRCRIGPEPGPRLDRRG
jgi:hypothetical protein